MLISPTEYKTALDEYSIVDCAVRDRDTFGFALDRYYSDEEAIVEALKGLDPTRRQKRFAVFKRNAPEGQRLHADDLGAWGSLRLGAMTTPQRQFLLHESAQRQMVVSSGNESTFEKPITPSHPHLSGFGVPDKIKTCHGHAYMAGSARSFAKRLGFNQYDLHRDLMAQSTRPEAEPPTEGFSDFDMFWEGDIYAAGGHGDLWHCEGWQWRQVRLPLQAPLQTVCCGGDGRVYVSGQDGLLFMGRKDRWIRINDGGVPSGWRDMVWFEDRAWATNDMGLWTIKNGEVRLDEDIAPKFCVCSGNLYVNDGVMLLAGHGGACFRENGQWHSIFTRAQMENLMHAPIQ